MPRFFQRLAIGQLDIPDLLARTEELAEWVGVAAGEYDFDAEGVIALGLSNGANIAASLLFHRPGTLAGAVLLKPMLPYPAPAGLDLEGAPVLVVSGGRDNFVPAEESRELAGQLEAHGAEVEYRFDPAAGHGLTQADLASARAWFSLRDGDPGK